MRRAAVGAAIVAIAAAFTPVPATAAASYTRLDSLRYGKLPLSVQRATMSSDGRTIALVAKVGDHPQQQVLLYDRVRKQVTLVSASYRDRRKLSSAPKPEKGVNLGANGIVMSANGRYVAYWSNADDITRGDDTPAVPTNGGQDFYLYDVVRRKTARVTSNGNLESVSRITDDGRYGYFQKSPGFKGGGSDDRTDTEAIYRVDLKSGAPEVVSIDPAGRAVELLKARYDISANGRYVLFEHHHRVDDVDANGDGNPDGGAIPPGADGPTDFAAYWVRRILVRDLVTKRTTDISARPASDVTGPSFFSGALDDNGIWVSFGERQTMPGNTTALQHEVGPVTFYVKNVRTGQVIKVREHPAGERSDNIGFSGNGRVVFYSELEKLGGGGELNEPDRVYAFNVATGAAALRTVGYLVGARSSLTEEGSVSYDGRVILVSSPEKLTPDDPDDDSDYYVHVAS